MSYPLQPAQVRSWSSHCLVASALLSLAACGRLGYAVQSSDAGTALDGGPPLDAGPALDGGPALDAGTALDGGPALDAGVVDASTALDGGMPDGGVDAGPSGWVIHSPTYRTTTRLWGVYGAAGDDLWVAGEAGEISHFDGTAWAASPNPATNVLFTFWAAAPNDVWLAGRACTILRWNGSAWSRVTATGCTAEELFATAGASPTDVWVAGTGGIVMRWNGSAWTTTLEGREDFWMVWVTSATNVYLVGTRGTILHWNGSTFTAEPGAPRVTITSIWGTGGGEYWAVGERGTIVHKVGAGAWVSVPSPTLEFLYGVIGTSPTNVWAVGSNGTILHHDGVLWSLASSPTTATLRNVGAVPGGGLRAIGDLGTVITHP